MKPCISRKSSSSIAIIPLTQAGYKSWLGKQPAQLKKWLSAINFQAKGGAFTLIPHKNGGICSVLAGIEEPLDLWSFSALAEKLPAGDYYIEGKYSTKQLEQFALGWALGCYQFTHFIKTKKTFATLALPAACDVKNIIQQAEAINWARDLINLPTNYMGPKELESECRKLAKQHKASFTSIVGDALLKQNYPTIHAVGRASVNAPRLIDMRWGNKNAPKVTLIGKGVCFDSGGLDIKSAGGMKLMKKDMGGAACTLALARLIMQAGLNVRLRVLIPAVENSISGDAFRPLDIIKTRKGITVEVENTDAEGRLILCDALAEADDEKPNLLIDFATLTGAARVALGTEIAAFFTPDDKLANSVTQHSSKANDPMWRLPLWEPYRRMLGTNAADMMNGADSPYAGAITAALYLKEFVSKTPSWLHVDLMAWNNSARPGRPVGGEAMAVRGLFSLICERYN